VGATLLAVLCAASLLAWLYLAFAHGRFWMGDQRLGGDPAEPERWPAVVAVVPARDEADVLGETLAAVLAQDYPGELHVVLVDDESRDATADVARETARRLGRERRLEVLAAKPRPAGWVGKVWALQQGVSHARGTWPDADLLWLSDADVAPAPRTLRRMVAKACAEQLDLVSLMVKLHCARGWERLLVPAFVYFFQKLYPFPRINDPASRTAGAAGGCVVLRAEALARAGGVEAIRAEVIDDCALGRRVKQVGRVWVGLGVEERSVRPYAGLRDIWDMVARSAYTQLAHSPARLGGTLAGLLLLYALPPAALLAWPLHGSAAAALLGGAAWLAQSLTFLPTLALYGRSPWLAPALPLAGLLYAGMTFDSAWRHHRGRGAHWKGRVGAGAASEEPPGSGASPGASGRG
jgi:hopene-associated glycosyltransferase HpnB